VKLAHGALLFGTIAGEARLERGSAQDHQPIATFYTKVRSPNDLHDLSGQGSGDLHFVGEWTNETGAMADTSTLTTKTAAIAATQIRSVVK
jgi:hypothetical protein